MQPHTEQEKHTSSSLAAVTARPSVCARARVCMRLRVFPDGFYTTVFNKQDVREIVVNKIFVNPTEAEVRPPRGADVKSPANNRTAVYFEWNRL